jgi:acetylornithine deacetylase/succinyl-diaminopimelate desuccinylase-like protein
MRISIKIFFILFINIQLNAQEAPFLKSIEKYYDDNEHGLIKEYFELLSLPNTFNDAEDLKLNASFILKMMEARGIKSKLLYNSDRTNIPVVYGEVLNPNATKTIIFYAHYDGQPVNPQNWAAGLHPFKPQLVSDRLDKGGKFVDFPKKGEKFDSNWRIYCRAAADDKAGVFSIINAYDAMLKSGQKPSINIKFFFEGEEEKGSTNLESVLIENKGILSSDLWVICDGPMPSTGQKQITFGVRGDVNMYLTVFGATRPLHSGNYGNWAPNPAHKLTRLLASMKDDEGRVLIDGFYDDVVALTEMEKQALKDIQDPGPVMQKELGFAQKENKDLSFFESIVSIPTLNINGMNAANTGKLASNIIPTTASATLDLRLVNGNDTERQIEKVKNHIRKAGYHIVYNEPTDDERAKYANIIFINDGIGYNAQKTPMELPIAKKIIDAVQSTSKIPVILLPSAGGSLPLYVFEKVLKTYPLTIPVVNYDNNQHGDNENLVLGRLREGIKTMAAIMIQKY